MRFGLVVLAASIIGLPTGQTELGRIGQSNVTTDEQPDPKQELTASGNSH